MPIIHITFKYKISKLDKDILFQELAKIVTLELSTKIRKLKPTDVIITSHIDRDSFFKGEILIEILANKNRERLKRSEDIPNIIKIELISKLKNLPKLKILLNLGKLSFSKDL
jgi:hypothetical protein